MKLDACMSRIALCLVVCTAAPATSQVQQFAGTWHNTDSKTRTLTTLRIEVVGTTVKVRAWAKCVPSDCSWGLAEGTLYAAHIRANVAETARTLSTDFSTPTSEIRLVLRPQVGGQLHLDVLTRYLDGSGRANVSDTATLQRNVGGDAPPY